MAQGIGVGVQRHFWVACCAGGKIENHRVARKRWNARKRFRCFLHLRHKILPAVTLAVDHELGLQRRTFRRGFVKMRGHVALPGANDRLDRGGIDAVDNIMTAPSLCSARIVNQN